MQCTLFVWAKTRIRRPKSRSLNLEQLQMPRQNNQRDERIKHMKMADVGLLVKGFYSATMNRTPRPSARQSDRPEYPGSPLRGTRQSGTQLSPRQPGVEPAPVPPPSSHGCNAQDDQSHDHDQGDTGNGSEDDPDQRPSRSRE
jgi:hypothetical protein